MDTVAFLQFISACLGILGSSFFAVGVVSLDAKDIADLTRTDWFSSKPQQVAFAGQKADYVFGIVIITFAFIVQALSFFFDSKTAMIDPALATWLPYIAIVAIPVLLLAIRKGPARWYADRLNRQILGQEKVTREQRAEERRQKNS